MHINNSTNKLKDLIVEYHFLNILGLSNNVIFK